MCVLKQEEFLNIRFKENEVERECWNKFKETHSPNEPVGMSQMLLDLANTYLDIAEKKKEIYKEHLDIEVETQKTEFENDETLMKLRKAYAEFSSGNISHNVYWNRVDAILFPTPKDRKYLFVNGQWVRSEE